MSGQFEDARPAAPGEITGYEYAALYLEGSGDTWRAHLWTSGRAREIAWEMPIPDHVHIAALVPLNLVAAEGWRVVNEAASDFWRRYLLERPIRAAGGSSY